MLSKFAQVTHDSKYVKPPHTKQHHAVTSVRDEGLMDHCEGDRNINTLCYGPNTSGFDGLERRSFCTLCLIVDSFRFFLDSRTENLYKVDRDRAPLAELHAVMTALKVLCTTTGMQNMEACIGNGRLWDRAYYRDRVPIMTYEGENFVLDQQATCSALKASSVTTANPDVHLTHSGPTLTRGGTRALFGNWNKLPHGSWIIDHQCNEN
ncbi:hypothetical protein GYMLUDRAFT_239380 [Collybiopsis luxurians FD-317 M1]|nr:hypothetical protein GYMLUDRAFT_239380 [Collybiopsis luxurians FD-317 M1]